MDNNICFYFDESFHSRKINFNTLKAQEYFDNYVSVGIGFINIAKDIELIKEFENKNKKNLSINDEVELKSSVVKKQQYKYGLNSFNNKSLELYKSFWNLLNSIDIIPYIFVSNKLEYILKQILDITNKDIMYSKDAVIYTIVKAINVYRPHEVLSKLLNNDANTLLELKLFLIKKLNENKDNAIKITENEAFMHAAMILDSVNKNKIDFNWDYKYIFYGLDCLINEIGINVRDIKIVIDKEGEYNNTYAKCKESGFKNVSEVDSKDCIELRCSDLLCGFIGKMMRAIYEDTKFVGNKYNQKINLSKEWFDINEEKFNLYKLIAKTINNKFPYYWSTCISIYFDIFFEFLAIINYFEGYDSYIEYKKHGIQEHLEKFENFLFINMQEKFKKFD